MWELVPCRALPSQVKGAKQTRAAQSLQVAHAARRDGLGGQDASPPRQSPAIADMQTAQEEVTRFEALTSSPRDHPHQGAARPSPHGHRVRGLLSDGPGGPFPMAGEVAEIREGQATARGLSVGRVLLVTAKHR
ncbi:hypothetical protein GCM10008949_50960 [Deinococcus humi]|nr:hypothetical protein GCM10008949_50960 [Deinococcus humi]